MRLSRRSRHRCCRGKHVRRAGSEGRGLAEGEGALAGPPLHLVARTGARVPPNSDCARGESDGLMAFDRAVLESSIVRDRRCAVVERGPNGIPSHCLTRPCPCRKSTRFAQGASAHSALALPDAGDAAFRCGSGPLDERGACLDAHPGSAISARCLEQGIAGDALGG